MRLIGHLWLQALAVMNLVGNALATLVVCRWSAPSTLPACTSRSGSAA